ncbi:hypothetical protein ACJX0J_016869, partial [Zea mays]
EKMIIINGKHHYIFNHNKFFATYMPLMALDSQLYTTHQRDYFHASESEMSGLHFHYLCHASTLHNYKKLAQARVNAMRPIIIYNEVSKNLNFFDD